jgi:ATP-binding protein involved in chromosome partitioning
MYYNAHSLMQIQEKNIRSAINNIKDPNTGKNINEHINKIIIEDGKVKFAIEYDQVAEGEIKAKEKVKLMCKQAINDSYADLSVDIALAASKVVKTHKRPVPGCKRVILVASGKGGVGKSTVAAHIAVALMNLGNRVGLLDADIYGPSIPTLFDIQRPPKADGDRALPHVVNRISLMSMGFMVDPNQANAWRGPMVLKGLHHLLLNTIWDHNGELDYLVVDTPPGTGDVLMTLGEKYEIDGAVIVTTPHHLATADAQKGIDLFNKLGIPLLGVVENMSYSIDPFSQDKMYLFGQGGGAAIADKNSLKLLGEVPISHEISQPAKAGRLVNYINPNSPVSEIFEYIAQELNTKCKS